ncbi:hypothetical protein [Candidatus Protochlamydia amoebophila]|uniref:Uncharacterized protein n=1 Tax=Candidatus Protochlamydia amoebophila TaxID=362787 RepID=A0A0C1H396_9BACT|nr:hypothetical protein [Candidatus Protochlamydia amoebophila]KIC72049.1 hypothetical protein DB44_CR00010 [Candidatus Protochlamydia amoebophila]
MINYFWSELRESGIHVRDQWQFELKSEFMINQTLVKNIYKQEFYFFIPSPLQINSETLTKAQFFSDQTNLIRYKTPRMSLSELIDLSYSSSPLNRLQLIIEANLTNQKSIIDELQLFANIFKTALRDRIFHISQSLEKMENQTIILYSSIIEELSKQVQQVTFHYREIQKKLLHNSSSQINYACKYVDEFISHTIDEYFLILLKQFTQNDKSDIHVKKELARHIAKEKEYRRECKLESKSNDEQNNESILYRQGLLNRFMLESLMLKSYRASLEEKHGNILGGVAAGIAMFVYMILFAWKISVFVINSFPFIMFAVFFYILKDRIKEGLKKIYYKKASRWFPDYSTEIKTQNEKKIGHLTENFAFIEPSQLPPDFLEIRNHHFHEELQALNRHESILHYKREVSLYYQPSHLQRRRKELTTIFRLNIQRFVQKASNALQPNLTLNLSTEEIQERLLPKVYHLNIIIRNTYQQPDFTYKSEIETFRVVVDKVGIKRVEQINQN